MRERDERGESNVLGGVIVTILILAVARVLGVDLIGYLESAVDWTADTIRDLGALLSGHSGGR
jgi:hypothetical protein